MALRATRLFGKDEMGCFLVIYIYIFIFDLTCVQKLFQVCFFSKGIHSLVLFRLECLIVFYLKLFPQNKLYVDVLPFFWAGLPQKSG